MARYSLQRKVYFMDPLLAQITPSLLPGARPANADGLVESVVASSPDS